MTIKANEVNTAMALAMRLTSFTTNDPTAVVVSKYFATSKNTLPSAFLLSLFTLVLYHVDVKVK